MLRLRIILGEGGKVGEDGNGFFYVANSKTLFRDYFSKLVFITRNMAHAIMIDMKVIVLVASVVIHLTMGTYCRGWGCFVVAYG